MDDNYYFKKWNYPRHGYIILLYVCQATKWRLEEQMRLLTIMDSYSLQPISMIHADTEKEDNALIHKNHSSSVNESKPKVIATPPRKQIQDDPEVATIMEASLYSALTSGPFGKRLLTESYQEVTGEIAGFLIEDWSLCPQMRYACS
ncbi:unnamed protein product [Mucor hiemalis]